MIFGNSKGKIISLEEENKYLKSRINAVENILCDLKEQNKNIRNINRLNKFYSDICLNLNNNNKYLYVLQKINKFYDDNKLFQKGILNTEIKKHIEGKQGEIYILNKFNEYIRDNRSLEYFYDFNLQNEYQNLQFDFIAIAKNNIYIIEVKNLNANELEICKSSSGNNYIKTYYEKKSYSITFNSMLKRYKLIDDIIKKFQAKYGDIHFNVFNIMTFIKDTDILLGENCKDISIKESDENIKNNMDKFKLLEVPMINGKVVQILSGKENIDGYFKNYTSKIYSKNYNDMQNKAIDNFTKFLKSDISFRESTDKNYIIQRVYEFFEEVYMYIENENLELKFND